MNFQNVHPDPNLAVNNRIDEPDVVFYDVRQEPFEIYGLYEPHTQPQFMRLPTEVANQVNSGVAKLHLNTAGGRVRFATDSQYIAIHADITHPARMPHIALTGSSAFDLYVDDPASQTSRFRKPFIPPYELKDDYESKIAFPDRKMRYFTVHFPSYCDVRSLFIGLQKDATLEKGMPYRNQLPIVYYGSSITQGGCASRPGNIYQNIIAQRMNLDYINLGFSGSGKAEPSIIAYMASLPMMAFVSDYDHNAPNPEYLEGTHANLYRKIRKAHPSVPYIMISRCDFDLAYDENIRRRDIIYETYREARNAGDRNVYFVDGESIFRGHYQNICTVDGCHPNDMGFALLADAVGSELARALTQSSFSVI